jgi:hypothetical protein
MILNTKFWLRISLFNLFIVALFGTLMRYKIGFEFPYFDQKHLQHGHSHFAFIGWITHTLFVLIIGIIQKEHIGINHSIYKILLVTNLVSAYGMLISFTIQGYGLFSIAFSTLSVFTAYFFAYYIFKDLKKISNRPYTNWFTAALWFNIISSLGTFTLAFMMASHNFNQNIHLASLYFYLHFQYNGFFMFACMGLLLAKMRELKPAYTQSDSIFWMFFFSCIPAYFLSVLWAKLPLWLFTIVIVAALTQLIAWTKFLLRIKSGITSKDSIFKSGRYLFLIIVAALSIKFLLQLGSTIPSVNKLVFGFRPIVIAYLHLILLAIISVFLVSYMYIYKLITINKMVSTGLVLFVVGVYLNEIVLGIQGIASFSYTVIPYIDGLLFAIALLILLSLVLLVASQTKRISTMILRKQI